MICCPLTSYDGDGDRCAVTPDVVGEFACCECSPTKTEHGTFERAQFYKCNCDCDHCIDSEHNHCTGGGKCTADSVFYTCAVCHEIREHFACNGFYYGQLWEDLNENLFPTLSAGGPCLQGLSPTAIDAIFESYLLNLEGVERGWSEHWGTARDECETTEEFSEWVEHYGGYDRAAQPERD